MTVLNCEFCEFSLEVVVSFPFGGVSSFHRAEVSLLSVGQDNFIAMNPKVALCWLVS